MPQLAKGVIARLARQCVGGKHRLTLRQFGGGKGHGLPRQQDGIGSCGLCACVRLGHQPIPRRWAKSGSIGGGVPRLAQGTMVNAGLGLARVERGDLPLGGAGLGAGLAPLGKPRLDGGGALAEGFGNGFGHTGNLEGGSLPRSMV
jgi:hypothetical protein